MDEIRQTEHHIRASVSLNYRELALLGHALRHFGMRYTIESHRTRNGITYQTARTDLLELQQKQLFVRSKSGRRFNFTASENLDDRLKKMP
jgi:Fic family protein